MKEKYILLFQITINMILGLVNISLGILNIYLGVGQYKKTQYKQAMFSFIVAGFVIGVGLMSLVCN